MELPVTISAAIFVALIFLDLFRHEYNLIPIHAIMGFFTIILLSFLCETNRVLIAWILLFIPFIIIILGIMVRKSSLQIINGSPPVIHIHEKPQNFKPAPYYL